MIGVPMFEVNNSRTNSLYEDNFKSKLVTWEDHIVGSYLSTVCILAVALNSMVIYTCVKHWSSLVMSDYYILNLACSDVLLPLSSFPMAISSSFRHFWIYGKIGCTAYGILGFFFGLVSIATLTLMGVTRYISICHPHINISGNKITRNIIICIYIYSFIWAITPLSGWGSYTVEAYGTSCTLQWNHNRSFITLMSVFCIITPSIVMFLAYGFILLKCRQSSRNVTRNRRGLNSVSKKETYLIKITFAMCWGFLVSWMPYAVVSMWTAYGDSSILPTRLTVMAVLLAKSSTVVNPIIYFLLSKKFRPMITESLNLAMFKGAFSRSSGSVRSKCTTNELLNHENGNQSTSLSESSNVNRAMIVRSAPSTLSTKDIDNVAL